MPDIFKYFYMRQCCENCTKCTDIDWDYSKEYKIMQQENV